MQLFKNNAYSALAGALTSVSTTLTVSAATGDRFPIVTGTDYFMLTLQDASNNIEIVKVTARASASDSMTITRAQEGTTARAWSIGDIAEQRITAGNLAALKILEGVATVADILSKLGATATGQALFQAVDAAAARLAISVQPTDSPTFTGTPAVPTAPADTSTTQIASTAFVVGQAGSTAPAGAGAAAVVGTSKKYARDDHVHPSTGITQSAGDNSTNLATTAYVKGELASKKDLRPITATVASNALTVGLNPTEIEFRSATVTDGTPSQVRLSAAISLVVPTGATLGTIAGQKTRLMVLSINNGGTPEVAIVNQAGALNLDGTGVISTTTMDANSDSANVVYSTTARFSVPYKIEGFLDIQEAAPGVWVTPPTVVHGTGDALAAAMMGAGFGQTWQNVTRNPGQNYVNDTGKPIKCGVNGQTNGAGGGYVYFTITQPGQSAVNVPCGNFYAGGGSYPFAGVCEIPPGATYSANLSVTAGSPSLNSSAVELR